MIRLLIPFLILAALLMASLAIDRPGPRADLTLGYLNIETLDGQMMQASEDIRYGYALYEGLCSFDPFTFEVVPGVAARWDVSDDKLTYTFHLRPDARWSDGQPVTAEDFAYTWRIGLMPDTSPPYQTFLYHIQGAKAFTDWCTADLERVQELPATEDRMAAAWARVAESKKRFKQMVGVRVVDPLTLEVKLEKYLPYFEEIAACWPLFPIPRHILERPANIRGREAPLVTVDPATFMLRRETQWIKPGHEPNTMVTNGPYRLDDWKFKREIRLVRNEHYWNARNVALKTIRAINFSDYNTLFIAYESGALDIVIGATPIPYMPELLEQAREGARQDVQGVNAYGIYYYVFNTRPTYLGKPNPFADKRVRRAFALALNKKQLVEKVTRLYQQPTDSFIPPGSIAGYQSPRGIPSDPDQARDLLAEAGYPGGKGFPHVVVSYNTSGGHENVAQAVRSMWERELGVEASLEGQEWKVFLRRRNSGEFMVARSGWFGDYMDPTTFLELFQKDNGNNDAGFDDPHYESLLERASVTLDPEKRMALLHQAEAYVVEDQFPVVPLYFYKLVHLFDRQRFEGVSLHPRNLHMFHRMRWLSQ